MAVTNPLQLIQSQLAEGMRLAKCKQCGCMKDALDTLCNASVWRKDANSKLLRDVCGWLDQIKPIRYT